MGLDRFYYNWIINWKKNISGLVVWFVVLIFLIICLLVFMKEDWDIFFK